MLGRACQSIYSRLNPWAGRAQASEDEASESRVQISDSDSEDSSEEEVQASETKSKALEPLDYRDGLSEADKAEFEKYRQWCEKEIKKDAEKLIAILDQLNGEFGGDFDKWVNKSWFNRWMTEWDNCSRGIREDSAQCRRDCGGITGGYPVEKGKDIESLRVQSTAYLFWFILQMARVVASGIVLHGQISGASNTAHGSVNGTFNSSIPVNGTGTDDPCADPKQFADYNMYDWAAAIQLGSTIATSICYAFHVPTQVREFMRGNAEQNRRRKAALNCFKGAVEFMTVDNPTPKQANLYRLGMENWRERESPPARLDVLRMKISCAREVLFFPWNLMLSSITSYNLVSGQCAIPNRVVAGMLQGLGGLFGSGQAICDLLQAWYEYRSANSKLADSEALLKNFLKIPEEYEIRLNRSLNELHRPAQDWHEKGVANSSALDLERREARKQRKEVFYSAMRGLKGGGGMVTSVMASVYGFGQAVTKNKAPLIALVFSMSGTIISGVYYLITWTKMEVLRNGEKNLKKELYLNAQHFRIRLNPEIISGCRNAGHEATYQDHLHMFRGCWESTVTHEAKFDQNEFVLLDVVSAKILETLHSSPDPFADVESDHIAELRKMISNKLALQVLRRGNDEDNLHAVDRLEQLEPADETRVVNMAESRSAKDQSKRLPSPIQQALKLPMVQWMHSKCKVSLSEVEALLTACCDKAAVFRTDMLKQGLAKRLRIALPIGKDKMEKRIKPSQLVRVNLEKLGVEKGDELKNFDEIRTQYRKTAGKVWETSRDHFLVGTYLEEFIASVLHIYDRSIRKIPKGPGLSDDLIRFAKLVEVACQARANREDGLKALCNADVAKLLKLVFNRRFNHKTFREFRSMVNLYRSASIFSRADQVKALKPLAKNGVMKGLHDLVSVDGWRDLVKDPILALGVTLLVDRVDRNQVIDVAVPGSPLPSKMPSSRVTEVPAELLQTSEVLEVLSHEGQRFSDRGSESDSIFVTGTDSSDPPETVSKKAHSKLRQSIKPQRRTVSGARRAPTRLAGRTQGKVVSTPAKPPSQKTGEDLIREVDEELTENDDKDSASPSRTSSSSSSASQSEANGPSQTG